MYIFIATTLIIKNPCLKRMTLLDEKEQKSIWTRLIRKVYGIDPLICMKCGSEMQIIAFITDPEQIDRIINHLVAKGRPPPGIAACCNMAIQRIFA